MAERVCIVVNKWWELEPVLWALLNDNARPADKLGWPSLNCHPRPRPNPARLPQEAAPAPRAVFSINGLNVEIWCISDLLEHLPNRDQSSTEKKADQLPKIFEGDPPALTVAVGTASSVATESWNGTVVVGTRAFLHNYHPGILVRP